MSLATPEKVRQLQETLHAKAKRSPGYRFYLLYDKVYRPDVLAFAYACCRANDGAPGIDRQDFADIEKYGVGRWLDELAEELRRAVDAHVRRRLRQWLGRKHKQRGSGGFRYTDTYLYETLGLKRLRSLRVSPSNANA